MVEQAQKVKGVVDLVFLIDATGSMAPCIDALKGNVEVFIDGLQGGNLPIRDWRAKVVGYRDYEADAVPLEDNPFVRDVAVLKSQLRELQPEGGGDDPESLLDALYKVATMEQSGKGAAEDPGRWRYRSEATRVIIVFSDASYKPTMALAEAKGGTLDDVANALTNGRIFLNCFVPNLPCYVDLSSLDKCEVETFEAVGGSFQAGLDKLSADSARFRKVLDQMAKSVSASAEVPPLE